VEVFLLLIAPATSFNSDKEEDEEKRGSAEPVKKKQREII